MDQGYVMTVTTTIKKTKRAKLKKPKKFYQKTFRQRIEYCLDWTPDEFAEYMDKAHRYTWTNKNQAGGSIHLQKADTTIIVIWICKGQLHPWHLSHECLHAVNFILDYVGVCPSFTNDEAQAYLLTELMRVAYDSY